MATIENIQYIDSASITVLIATGSLTGSLSGTSTNSLSSSVALPPTTASYYFDLSFGFTGIQPTYVSTSSTYTPSTNQISGSLLGITASHFGTSSVAVYATTASQGAKAWASIYVASAASISSASYNCNVTRSALGIYFVSFIHPATSVPYAALFDGFSGSTLTATASQGNCYSYTTNGFTMSVFKINGTTTNFVSDFTTGSIVVYSY
jgi:hypothetical protein